MRRKKIFFFFEFLFQVKNIIVEQEMYMYAIFNFTSYISIKIIVEFFNLKIIIAFNFFFIFTTFHLQMVHNTLPIHTLDIN